METEILNIIGLVFGMGVQTFIIIRYLMDRMDSKVDEERKNRTTTEAHLYEEVNKMRDTHVRRDDFHRHVDNVEKQIANIMIQITQMGNSIGGRLDNLMSMVANSKGEKKE